MRPGCLLVLLLASCEPPAADFEFDRKEAPVFRRSSIVAPTTSPKGLKVMAWNIKYGAARIDFWFDYWGDRVQMTRSEVSSNLADVERLIREVDPDVLLTEEIEVDSRRSAYVDMVEHILEHTNLNYGAYFQTWNSRYIPSEGLGRIDLGNAIFSKYRITSAEAIREPDRTDLDALHKEYYLHRAIGHAVLHVGERDVAAYVVHTEAYDTDGTKQRQLTQLFDIVRSERLPFVLGGDFNELPPTAVKTADFDDIHPNAKGTEFDQPPYTPNAMRPFYDSFVPLIDLARYGKTEAEQRRFYSHSIRGPLHGGDWNRTLDHLFVNQGSFRNSDVLQAPGRLGITSDPRWLSDHAPIVGTWELP